MTGRIIRSLSFLICCIVVAGNSWSEKLEQRVSGTFQAIPVFASPRQIPQVKSDEPAEEEWPHHEITPQLKDFLLRQQSQPILIPQHSIQQDSSGINSVADMRFNAVPSLIFKTPGIPQTDFSPPDPTLAVGSRNVLIAVNRVLAIYSKDGNKLFETTMKSWFGRLPDASSASFYDPRVSYDQYSGHYLVLSDAVRPRDGRSWYFLAVSRTRDPMGSWAMYELDMQLNGNKRAQIIADFPGIGFDPSAVYLTGNMFRSTGSFAYGKIRVLRKSELYSFGALHWSDFWNMIDATGVAAKNIQPAHCFGATPVGYVANTNEAKGDQFTLWKISNPGSSTPTLSSIAVPVSSYLVPPNAVQKGSNIRISTNDSGLTSAVFRNGSLFTAQALAWDWGSGTVSAIRLYQISKDGNVLQEITYGADGKYYFFPDVIADSSGNISVIFNRSSASEFAGMFYSGRRGTDAPGMLRSAVRVQAGLASYKDPNRNGLDPWGDFNGIALDPVDKTVWLFSEFVKSTTSWGTQIGQVSFVQP
jgi:hypothetical protein